MLSIDRPYFPHAWVGGDIVRCHRCGIAEYDFVQAIEDAPMIEWDCESVDLMNETTLAILNGENE